MNDVQIVITKEEATVMVKTLKSNWIPLNDQKIIYGLIRRIEKELGLE
jgi:hypothetical protein